MWQPNHSNYCDPVIAEISEGHVALCGFKIQAIRGPQDAVFVYAETNKFLRNKSVVERFGGIGCYGYKKGPYDYSEGWAGVEKATVKEFFAWLDKISGRGDRFGDEAMCEWVKLCKKARPLRYNQGNMYFASRVGLPLEATPPGKPGAPMLSKITTKMKKKGRGTK